MATTTWELHYELPRYSADKRFMVEYLELLENVYTSMAIDIDRDEKGIHVMVSDVQTFKNVIMGLSAFGPQRVSVTLAGDLDVRAQGNAQTLKNVVAVAVLNETGDGDGESAESSRISHDPLWFYDP